MTLQQSTLRALGDLGRLPRLQVLGINHDGLSGVHPALMDLIDEDVREYCTPRQELRLVVVFSSNAWSREAEDEEWVRGFPPSPKDYPWMTNKDYGCWELPWQP